MDILHDKLISLGIIPTNYDINNIKHFETDFTLLDYKNEDDKIVAAATEDIDYDNIYLRLSLLGVQQVVNGENFIKVNIE